MDHISTYEPTGNGGDDQNNTYAMLATCDVEIKPEIIVLAPIWAMRWVREGVSTNSTPIRITSKQIFAEPHSTYDTIINPRSNRVSSKAISTCSSRYATNLFLTSFMVRRGWHQQKKTCLHMYLLCLTSTCKAFVRKFSVRLCKPCQCLIVDLQPTYLITYYTLWKV